MKRIISVMLAVCMLLGLCSGYAFAEDTAAAAIINGNYGEVNIYSTYYTVAGVIYNHSGDYVISGTYEGIYIREQGTYNIMLHDVTCTAGLGYATMQICDNATLNLSIAGVNTLTGAGNAVFNFGTNINIVLDVLENSSLSISSGEGYSLFNGTAPVMKDGTAVSVEKPFYLSKGTPKKCEMSITSASADKCKFSCTDHGVNMLIYHDYKYVEKDSGHTKICNYCGYDYGVIYDHTIYYYCEDKDRCVPYCYDCEYEGEATSHNMIFYGYYDEQYCINYCSNCYSGDPATDLVAHQFEIKKYPATKIEAAKNVKTCKICMGSVTEYNKENSIIFELGSHDGIDWNQCFLMPYVNGEPATLVRNFNGGEAEEYALAYDKNASYSFYWNNSGDSSNCSVKIYLPGQEEPIFSKDDMSEYDKYEEVCSVNTADYTELDEAMASIPLTLEYYTKESVETLVTAIKGVKRMMPAGKQDDVDAMTAAIKAAVEGLVETDQPSTLGVINHNDTNGDVELTSAGYTVGGTSYEYTGPYTIFQAGLEPVTSSISAIELKADITAINLFIRGEDGNFIIDQGADITLKAVGANAFISEGGNERAGIMVSSSSKLKIDKSTDNIVAVSASNAAGIGGDDYSPAGCITIDGGAVFGLSTNDGAGIGGGYKKGFKTITINGGRVHGECLDEDGAGIGVGDDGDGGDIIINGGDINALSLDDDGAGMGGADNGHCDSITINGGTIVVGSDDAAGIGGGQDSDSYAGKITINGGVIKAHFDHDTDESLIGNGNTASDGKTAYNFVQINGGAIFDNYCDVIEPTPFNKYGDPVVKVTFSVHENYNGKEVVLQLTNGTTVRVPVVDGEVQTYIAKNTKVMNQAALKKDPVVTIKDTSKIFKDVKKGAWYKSAIDYAYSYGFVNGVEKDEFGLNSPVTRGMFITILARMSGIDTSTAANKAAKTQFTDVKKGEYYAAAIAWASKAGIVSGTSKTTFAPNAPIQRQQLCVMIANYAEFNGIVLTAKEKAITFADASDIAKYARKAVAVCQRADIINGYKEGGKMVVKPANTATRAEAAKILATFHKEFAS